MTPKPQFYSLQRTLILYFLLIGFASALVGIEFVIDTRDPALQERLTANVDRYVQNQIGADALLYPLERIRNKALLMVAMILVVIIIVLTMFIRNVTGPLQHMIDVAKEISQGDLSRSIRIDSQNELAELGTGINDLTSNLQEIILHTRNTCQAAENCLDRIRDAAAARDGGYQDPVVAAALDEFGAEFANLGAVVACFQFYTVEG
jgi:methyl-accepting chemotaxis protein